VGRPVDASQLFARSGRDDPAERSKGLSPRDNLPADGLLLQWDVPGRHPIWMAGMRFPLDLVWLQSDGRVAAVLINVPICSSPPCPLYEPAGTNQAIAVLQLAAGGALGGSCQEINASEVTNLRVVS
jgi:uncharacterized membrane protein (UPF0127 family)